MWIPRWFKRLEKAVTEAVSKAKEELHQEIGSVGDAAQTREQKQAEVGTAIAAAIRDAADTVPDYEKAQRKKEYGTQWAMFGVALAGAVFAGAAAGGAWYYAHIAACQLQTMNSTYGEIKQQTQAAECAAKAATEQTALLRQELEQSNSAVITIAHNQFGNNFTIDSNNGITVAFVNEGHSTATQFAAEVVMSLHDPSTNRIIGYLKTLHYNGGSTIPPIPVLDSDRSRNVRPWTSAYIATADQRELITSGKAAIVAALSFSYNNGFRKVSDTACAASLSFPAIFRPMPNGHPQPVGGGTTPISDCDQLAENMASALNGYNTALSKEKQYEAQQPK